MRISFAGRIALALASVWPVAAQTCDLTETPRITTIVNAASFLTGVSSMNAIVSLGGSNFQRPGQSRAAGAADLAAGRFPTELGCIAVDIDGVRAPLIYVDFTQINAQVPTFAPPREAQVRVIANPGRENELRSAPFLLQVRDQSPAFFRLLPTPCIASVLVDGVLSGDPALLPNVRGVKAGEVVSLFATGLGQTDPVWQAGEIPNAAARVVRRVQVEFNDQPIPDDHVLYAGLVPGSISGLYQINIRIPRGINTNAHHTVRVRISDSLSLGASTLFVAPD
jgi:uncharacterized protein (TIGR03437 family)